MVFSVKIPNLDKFILKIFYTKITSETVTTKTLNIEIKTPFGSTQHLHSKSERNVRCSTEEGAVSFSYGIWDLSQVQNAKTTPRICTDPQIQMSFTDKIANCVFETAGTNVYISQEMMTVC